MAHEARLTLSDGTVVRVGDKVMAYGEQTTYRRVCTVIGINRTVAMLTAPWPFGTVPRRARDIRRCPWAVK